MLFIASQLCFHKIEVDNGVVKYINYISCQTATAYVTNQLCIPSNQLIYRKARVQKHSSQRNTESNRAMVNVRVRLGWERLQHMNSRGAYQNDS